MVDQNRFSGVLTRPSSHLHRPRTPARFGSGSRACVARRPLLAATAPCAKLPGDGGALPPPAGFRLQPSTVNGHTVAVGRPPPVYSPWRALCCMAVRGALPDGLTSHGSPKQHVEHEPPRGAAGVDVLPYGEQRSLPGAK